MRFWNKAWIKITLGGVMLFLLFQGIEWLIPQVVDLKEIKGEIESSVANEVFPELFDKKGWQFSIEDLEVKLAWDGILAELSELRVLNPKSEMILSSQKTTARLRYWPLIIGGTPELARIELENLAVNLEDNPEFKFFGEQQEKKSRITLVKSKKPKKLKLKPKETPSAPIVLRDTAFVIKEHQLFLGDWLDGKNGWKLRGDWFELQHLESENPFVLKAETAFSLLSSETSERPEQGNIRSLGQLDFEITLPQTTFSHPNLLSALDLTLIHSLKLHLKDLKLEHWEHLLTQYNIPFHGRGIIDSFEFSYEQNKPRSGNSVLIENFEFLIQSLESSQLDLGDYSFAFDSGFVHGKTRLLARALFDQSLLDIRSDPYFFNASGSLQLLHPLSFTALENEQFLDEAQMDFKLKTSMLPISLLRVLPDASSLGQLFEQSSGLIQLDTRLTGELDSPDIQGAIRVEDLAFTHQKLDAKTWDLIDGGLEQLYGMIKFKDDWVHLDDFKGKLNGTPFKINGQYHLKDKQLKDVILESEHLDLNDLRLTLLHFSSIFKLNLPAGLENKLKKIEFEGALKLELKAKGFIERPIVKGLVQLQGLGLHPYRHPEKKLWHHINSVLSFDGKTLSFLKSSGYFGDDLLTLSGDYQVKKEALNLSLKASFGSVQKILDNVKKLAPVLLPELPIENLSRLSLEGAVDSEFNIKGSLTKPLITGQINLKQLGIFDTVSQLKAHDVNGKIRIYPNQIKLDELQGQVNSVAFKLEGVLTGTNLAKLKDYKFRLLSEKINLAELGKMLDKLPKFREMKTLASLKGLVGIDLTASGQVKELSQVKAPKLSGQIKMDGFAIRPADLGATIRLEPVLIRFNDAGQLNFPKTVGHLGQLAFDVKGTAEKGFKDYSFSVDTGDVALNLLNTQREYFEKILGIKYRPLEKTKGTFQFLAHMTAGQFLGDLSFNEAGFAWTSLPAIEHLNGQIHLILDKKGHPTLKSKGLYFDLDGLRFENSLSAKLEQLPAKAALNRLPMKVDATLDVKIRPKYNLKHAPLAHIHANLHEDEHRLVLENTAITFHQLGRVLIDGLIENPLTEDKRGFHMKVRTPEPLRFDSLGDFFETPFQATGNLGIDLAFTGHDADDMLIIGAIDLNKISIPPLRLNELTGKIKLKGVEGDFNLSRVAIPGVLISVKGIIEDTMVYPFPLDEVEIKGDLFVVPAWEAFIKDIGEGLIRKQFIEPLFGPIKPEDPRVPVEFRDAQLSLKEVIYDNIIFENIQGKMNLNASGFFELLDTEVDVASGKLRLNMSMNPKDNNFTSAIIDVTSVKANALARALLNAPNQIFGDLSGHIVFATEGVEEVDLMNNANGSIQFSISDGRLPAIAKIETLLAGANVIRGGLLGLNLNNIFRALSPFNTNYFAELSGNMQIAEGVTYTDDLLSDGENLDLLIQGRIRLIDSDADLTVYGSMSQDVSGILGKLGKLSLKSFVRFVPGLGFMPGIKKGGIASFIPGIGYVPGLGGRAKALNRFEVKIKGPLDNPKSVQSFNWAGQQAGFN